MSIATLPSIRSAPLPKLYEQARTSLEKCARIDECEDWRNKADALASYAKQSQDRSLFEYARRIALRATKRAGVLLKQVESMQRTNLGPATTQGSGRYAAGKDAGLSARKIKEAVRVANVPAGEFERLTESRDPPTVKAMAILGTKASEWKPPKNFAAATKILGAMRRLSEQIGDADATEIAAAVLPHERDASRQVTGKIAVWSLKLNRSLGG